jgi:hypothetical protein
MKVALSVLLFFFTIFFLLQVYQLGVGAGLTSTSYGLNITQSAGSGPTFGSIGVVSSTNTNCLPFHGIVQCQQNNTLLTAVATNPLAVVLIAAGIFATLGLLGGAFGFGLHAPVITIVAIMVSLVVVINAALLVDFGGLPQPLLLLVNGFFGLFGAFAVMDVLDRDTE